MPTLWRILLSDVTLTQEEEDAVLRVLRSGWLSLGPQTEAFEEAFAEYVGARHAVAVSSGTAALHLALEAAGVGPGDEVIVPALTFVATANVILYCGATPVFADIRGPHDLRVDEGDIERKITLRTKAIIPVHYAGYPCDLDRLRKLASRHSLRIIEDAAHAPGTMWRGKSVGGLSDAACFSFFANKNMTCAEGGMITTNDSELAALARRNRSHGMTTISYDRYKGHQFSYDVVSIGRNYRPTELQSAVGLVQLRKLAENNQRRRELVSAYRTRLAEVPGVTVPFTKEDDTVSSCHLMVVLLPADANRMAIQEYLREHGIQTSVHYPLVHHFSAYAGRFPAEVPRTEALCKRLLSLPLHPKLTRDDVATVCATLKDALKRGDAHAS